MCDEDELDLLRLGIGIGVSGRGGEGASGSAFAFVSFVPPSCSSSSASSSFCEGKTRYKGTPSPSFLLRRSILARRDLGHESVCIANEGADGDAKESRGLWAGVNVNDVGEENKAGGGESGEAGIVGSRPDDEDMKPDGKVSLRTGGFDLVFLVLPEDEDLRGQVLTEFRDEEIEEGFDRIRSSDELPELEVVDMESMDDLAE